MKGKHPPRDFKLADYDTQGDSVFAMSDEGGMTKSIWESVIIIFFT